MGRRGRRRARETVLKAAEEKPSRRPLPDGQRMARVNIDPTGWREFLRTAAAADRSVADYLGHLVRKELRRVTRREGRGPAPPPDRSRELVTVSPDTQEEVM